MLDCPRWILSTGTRKPTGAPPLFVAHERLAPPASRFPPAFPSCQSRNPRLAPSLLRVSAPPCAAPPPLAPSPRPNAVFWPTFHCAAPAGRSPPRACRSASRLQLPQSGLLPLLRLRPAPAFRPLPSILPDA